MLALGASTHAARDPNDPPVQVIRGPRGIGSAASDFVGWFSSEA
jgi:hypothetical protein